MLLSILLLTGINKFISFNNNNNNNNNNNMEEGGKMAMWVDANLSLMFVVLFGNLFDTPFPSYLVGPFLIPSLTFL